MPAALSAAPRRHLMHQEPAVTPEERQALHNVLVLAEIKRGGESGTARRVRRSLHLKIVGGFLEQLNLLERDVGSLHPTDLANQRIAAGYVVWLQANNVPVHDQPLPAFERSAIGPSLFPVPVAAPSSVFAPETPGVSELASSSAAPSGISDVVPRASEGIVSGKGSEGTSRFWEGLAPTPISSHRVVTCRLSPQSLNPTAYGHFGSRSPSSSSVAQGF